MPNLTTQTLENMTDLADGQTTLQVTNNINASFANIRTLDTNVSAIKNSITPSALLNIIHPVGCYYWSSEPIHPKDLFGGGTWEKIEDKFLFAASTKHPASETGGSETRKLTIEQMPKHEHILSTNAGHYCFGGANTTNKPASSTQGFATQLSKIASATAGESQPFNIMPPYITAYCWHRIA